MSDYNAIKKTIKYFATEFVMVFLGVLLAFMVNDWGESRKDKKTAEIILSNIIEDVRNDSAKIISAIEMLEVQHGSIDRLINHLSLGNYDSADFLVKSCYSSFSVFEPTTVSYQSMIYGGDLKLMNDYGIARLIREVDHSNNRVIQIHNLYFLAIEDLRNTFICKENMNPFKFSKLNNRIEFWNRLNFLQGTYIKNYEMILRQAQSKYHDFLRGTRFYK
jgi:uncharacterized protein DUF6090